MKVRVVCFGVLREYLPEPGSGSAQLEVPAGTTVSDLLAAMGAEERFLHLCLVDGQRADADRVLLEGAEVTLMPPFSGG